MSGKITAILLAAGMSKRMGTLKALLPWQGVPLIQYQVEQMQAAGIDEIIVVLGHQAEHIQPVIKAYDVKIILNENYQAGKSTSIQKGAANIKGKPTAIFISSVDQPVPHSILRQLIKQIEATKKKIIIPVCEGKRGHPILVSGTLQRELLTVNEETKGLRNIIHNHENGIVYMDTDNRTVLTNFNTQLDYQYHLNVLQIQAK